MESEMTRERFHFRKLYVKYCAYYEMSYEVDFMIVGTIIFLRLRQVPFS